MYPSPRVTGTGAAPTIHDPCAITSCDDGGNAIGLDETELDDLLVVLAEADNEMLDLSEAPTALWAVVPEDLESVGDESEPPIHPPLEPMPLPVVKAKAPTPSTAKTLVGPKRTRSKPAKPRKSNGAKRREEIIFLRGESVVLEGRIAELEERKRLRTPDDEEAIQRALAYVPVWKEIADRQAAKREAVEAENRRLRAMVANQVRVAASLQTTVRSKLGADVIVPLPSMMAMTNSLQWDVTSPLGQPTIFADFLARIETMYNDTDVIFSDTRFRGARHTRDVQVKYSPLEGVQTVEIVDSQVLPFGLNDTNEAAWQVLQSHALLRQGPMNELYVEATENQVLKHVAASLVAPQGIGEFAGKFAARRHIEGHRVVMLSHALMDSLEFMGKPASGMLTRHMQWTVVEPLRESTMQTTQIHRYHVIIPEFVDSTDTEKNIKIALLTNFVLSNMSDILDNEQAVVENLLLEGQKDMLIAV